MKNRSVAQVESLFPVGSYVFHTACKDQLLLEVLDHHYRPVQGRNSACIRTLCVVVGSSMEHEPIGKRYWVPPENLRWPNNPLMVIALASA